MQFLKTLTLKRDHLLFKENTEFSFEPGLNLLVGEQGAGKSTLLRLLANPNKDAISWDLSIPKEPLATMSFDFEKDNPRMKSQLSQQGAFFEVSSRFVSHGETNMAILQNMEQAEGKLILLDEPESALSPKNQYELIKILQRVSAKNQVIAATHCIVLITATEFVLDFNNPKKGTKTPSKTFLKDAINT